MNWKKVAAYIALITIATSCSQRNVAFLIEKEEAPKAPATIQFSNTSQDFDSYVWDFGDGTISSDTSPVHTYYLSGTYTVTLKGRSGDKTKETKQVLQIAPPEKCLIRIETPMGNMLAELSDLTPKHRDNFLKLANEGYYDGLLFHRVKSDFMIQGGDPNSRNAPAGQPLGSGSPGYQIDAEFHPELAHVKGALAAARIGGPSNPQKRSSGSQFYIVQGKSVNEGSLNQMERRHGQNYTDEIREAYYAAGGTPFLDQDYTVFGQVIGGIEVIDKIAAVQTNNRDRPQEDVSMKITVIK